MNSKKQKKDMQLNKTVDLTPQGLIGLNQSDDEILELIMDQVW